MRANKILDRLRVIFSGSEPIETNATWHSSKIFAFPNAAEQVQDVRHIIERLEAQEASSVIGGCVQLLGLEGIMDRLGPDCERFLEQVMQIAQGVLAEHLGSGDVYRLVDETSFQICFETADEALAKQQVQRAAEAIESRIAKAIGLEKSQLSVASFVAPVPCSRIKDASDPLSALYSNLLEIRNAVNSRAIDRHSIPALRYAGALFQPLWSNRDFGLTKNRCVLDTLAGAAAAKYLEDIEELDDLVEALANLDCVLFAKSVEGLHHALGEVKRATIVIPVHFQTLASEQREFLEIASTLPLPYRRFVLLDLIGVPTATTRRELLKALKTGRAVSDRIILQLSPTDHRMDQNVRNLVWGLSMNLGELDSDNPHVVEELTRFALLSGEQGLYSFAYGANTIGKAKAIVEAGFDYVGGSAVGNTVPAPRPHGRFTPLFGEVAIKASAPEKRAGLREHPRFAPLDPNSTITLPDGRRYPCRIPNVSASGAEVLCDPVAREQEYLVVGSIPARVVRTTARGFAVRFLEVQQPSAIEIALQTPVSGNKLLDSLRSLTT